jgi:hypothetical protein
MTIYLLRPTPSEVWKLCLVLRLGACIVPSIDVLLGVAAVVRFLVVGATPVVRACVGSVSVLHIKSAGETRIHVVIPFHDVGKHWRGVPGWCPAWCHHRDKSWDAATATTRASGIVRERCAWGAPTALPLSCG